jgi:hypothetical protein
VADYRPQIPAADRSLHVSTFQDAISELLDGFDADGAGRHGRVARRAVLEAYRDLPYRHNWHYYRAIGQISTVASQDDGTIEYTHSTRLVTLTGATWPTDARFYEILIDNQIYKVEAYVSSTTLTLTQDSNPGADIAAGETYELFRKCYPVPVDFRQGNGLVELTNSYWPEYVSADRILDRMNHAYSPQSDPDCYTIRSAQEHYGGLVFEFAPPPATAKTYNYQYVRDPRPLQMFGKTAEYTEGTVSVSGVTATGTSTAWTSDMVGCVMRFPQAGSSSTPTGFAGNDLVDEPYAEQRIIQAVGSATSATLDAALSGTYSGSRYSIGSPLDIAHGAMYSAFMRLAEAVLSRMMSKSESLDNYGAPQRMSVFKQELRDAMIADNRNKTMQPVSYYIPDNLADLDG